MELNSTLSLFSTTNEHKSGSRLLVSLLEHSLSNTITISSSSQKFYHHAIVFVYFARAKIPSIQLQGSNQCLRVVSNFCDLCALQPKRVLNCLKHMFKERRLGYRY